MRCKFYLDEDIDVALEQALINRGVDVVSTLKAGKIGNTDEEQLSFAKNEKRIIITHNVRDFVILHKKNSNDDRTHSGIIVSDQLPIGTLLKRVMKLWFTLDAKEMESRIEFLSNWK
jgi:hypothetical protein